MFSPFCHMFRQNALSLPSVVGAVMGEQGCLLKLACLSGKRAASVTGATTAAMMLSAAHSMMPEAMKQPYQVRDTLDTEFLLLLMKLMN